MKETKFRAWDKEAKVWLDPQGDYATEFARAEATNLIWCDLDGIAVCDGSAYLLDECGNYFYLNPERFEIVEFTGLHDKNGKEIYEGDILDARGQFSENMPQPVIWWNTGWYAGYDDGNFNNVTSLQALEKPWIIGNIYENPELLDK